MIKINPKYKIFGSNIVEINLSSVEEILTDDPSLEETIRTFIVDAIQLAGRYRALLDTIKNGRIATLNSERDERVESTTQIAVEGREHEAVYAGVANALNYTSEKEAKARAAYNDLVNNPLKRETATNAELKAFGLRVDEARKAWDGATGARLEAEQKHRNWEMQRRAIKARYDQAAGAVREIEAQLAVLTGEHDDEAVFSPGFGLKIS